MISFPGSASSQGGRRLAEREKEEDGPSQLKNSFLGFHLQNYSLLSLSFSGALHVLGRRKRGGLFIGQEEGEVSL